MSQIENNFLNKSNNYIGYPNIDMEQIAANPDFFVITECIDACKILWAKNIYTANSSSYEDEETWIEFDTDDLSAENLEIINDALVNCIIDYNEETKTIKLGVKGHGERAKAFMITIAGLLHIQDVPEHKAYMDLTTGLTLAGCSKEIENPEYISDEEFTEKFNNISSAKEGLNFVSKYLNNLRSQTINVFDQTKVKSPVESNFEGTPYIFEEETQRVYLSNYHYKKHLKYLEIQKFLEETKKLEIESLKLTNK